MEQAFDYSRCFNRALEQIKALRNPYARKQETVDFGWYTILQHQIVNIGAADFRRPIDVIDKANEISILCIYNIIFELIAQRAKYCKILIMSNDGQMVASEPFIFIDTQADRLVIVKNIEKDIALITEDYIPDGITGLMQKTTTTSYAQVYLLHEKANLQFVAPNNELNKTAHGKNVHSLPWLFETYFGEDEYTHFREALNKFTLAVDEYLGYSVVRSLSPTALFNFKKITENALRIFNYDQIIHKIIVSQKQKQYWIKDMAECKKLKQQFLENGAYRILLSERDYSESLITAEWLLDSMSKANAIDLTVIGTGYFKAMEQLLFALIQLHDPAFDPDSTLGDYATFYKNNRDQVLRKDVHWTTRNYVYEAIYEYAVLRNGYFHKHNIHDLTIIQNIRSATFILMYLILGCQTLSSSDYASLGISAPSHNSDFQKLCEYISFHNNSFFCAEPDGYPEQWIQVIPQSEVPQSIRDTEPGPCVYYNVFGAKNAGRFSEKDAPRRIWAGKLGISHTGSIEFSFEKTVLIFETGHYVGPALVDEPGFDY